MSCKKVSTFDSCRLIQESFVSPIFDFGTLDVSNDTFIYSVKPKYLCGETKELPTFFVDDFKVGILPYNLPISEYSHELLWIHGDKRDLVFQGTLKVTNNGQSCCGGESGTIEVITEETTINVSYSESVIIVNNGGGGSSEWGGITGNIENQTDLVNFIDGKIEEIEVDLTGYATEQWVEDKGYALNSDIPTVGNGTITITQGGETKGTFTTNQIGNTTIEVDQGGGTSTSDVLILNNLAELRTKTKEELESFKVVTLLGYYVSGDTPQALDYIISSTLGSDNNGTIIEVDGIKLEAITSSDIDLSYFGFKKDVDSTLIIQNALNYIENKDKRLVFYKNERLIISDCLKIGNRSSIVLGENTEVFLANGSDCRMVENKNMATITNPTLFNTDINIIGGIWLANGDNQTRLNADGAINSGFLFSGIKNMVFKPTKIINTNTYGSWFINWENILCENIYIDQGNVPATMHNQDGLHFNGTGFNATVKNIVAKTWDDIIAFNADDVYMGGHGNYPVLGNQEYVIIDNILSLGSLNGIRLLCASKTLKNVWVSNIKGTYKDNIIAISSYQLGTGGKFININIDGVYGELISNYMPLNNEYSGFILINDAVESLSISNVIRNKHIDSRRTIRVQPRANIGSLMINNVTDIYTPTGTTEFYGISVESGSIINNLTIDKYRLLNGVIARNFPIKILGSNITNMIMTDVFADKSYRGFDIESTTINTLSISNLLAKDVTYSLRFKSSNITSLISNNVISKNDYNAYEIDGGTISDSVYSVISKNKIAKIEKANLSTLSVFADNASAVTGGLLVGDVYKTATGQLMTRY